MSATRAFAGAATPVRAPDTVATRPSPPGVGSGIPPQARSPHVRATDEERRAKRRWFMRGKAPCRSTASDLPDAGRGPGCKARGALLSTRPARTPTKPVKTASLTHRDDVV